MKQSNLDIKLVSKWEELKPKFSSYPPKTNIWCRFNYKTGKIKAGVYPNSDVRNISWHYEINSSTGIIRKINLPSPKEAMDEVDRILKEDGWKFLDDDRLAILI